jgi:hypothetical protein
MNQPSQHTEWAELLPAAALDLLEGDELHRVEAHTRECTECSRLLQDYRDAAASIGMGLPSDPLDRDRSQLMRAELLARAGSLEPRLKSGPRPWARFVAARVPAWSGWAVAAGLAGVLLVHHGFHRPVAYGWVVAGVLAIILVGVGVYALAQRARVAELEGSSRRGDRGKS